MRDSTSRHDSTPPVAQLDHSTAPITVRCVGVDDDRNRLTAALAGDDGVEVESVATSTAALVDLEAVDCVVSGHELPETDGLELLAAIREREPLLPFILFATDPPREVVEALHSVEWTGYVENCGTPKQAGVLAGRIHALVDHQRTVAVARRTRAAVELATNAIALVDPDGVVEFANQPFARRFGASPGEIAGREWRDLFPDAEVERFESDVFPTVADGWRWVGTCVGRLDDGDTFVTRASVTGLDDGCLVFTLPEHGSGA